MINRFFSRVVTYFDWGLLAIAPLILAIYFIYKILFWVDGLLPIPLSGLCFLIVTAIILALGSLISTVIPQSVGALFEEAIRHLPLVRLLYFSVKDLLSTFVGDKKKINQPVLVSLNKESGICKIGFIVQTGLSHLNVTDAMMVYCPHSYAFSGEPYVVSLNNVRLLNLSSAEAMKLIVLGGVSK